MTFEQFQATKRYCDLGKSLSDENLQHGNLYLGQLFIENTETWVVDIDHVGELTIGKWYTLIGRSEYDSDNLEDIERVLYEYALQEEFAI